MNALAVRTTAGVLDASTLGKIDVIGPDAAAFLDRMYTNRMSTLAVGSIRYGLMLGLDGMVFDDGVVMRLADDRFFVTTTTGGAAAVLDRFEEWLQTEWPDLRVYCTERHRAVGDGGGERPARARRARRGRDRPRPRCRGVPVHVVARRHGGRHARPRGARELHRRAGVRDQRRGLARAGHVGGRDGRGRAVRDHAVRHRGDARAARREGVRDRRPGHRRHGDRRTTWACRGSSARTTPTSSAGDRSRDPTRPAPSASSWWACSRPTPSRGSPKARSWWRRSTRTAAPPVPMLGHVTSSYRSAADGRTFALAMVAGGRALRGSTVVAPIPGGDAIEATISEPVFFDPENVRREGVPGGTFTHGAAPALLDPIGAARDPLTSRLSDLPRIEGLTGGSVRVEHVRSWHRWTCGSIPPRRARCRSAPASSRTPRGRTAGRAALWLGPDEWLILGQRHDGDDIVAELGNAARGCAPLGRRRQREPGRVRALPARGAWSCWREAAPSTCTRDHGRPACAPRRCWARRR